MILQNYTDVEYPDSMGGFMQTLLEQYTSVMGVEIFFTFVFGGFTLASFIRSDSLIIPLGFLFMTGGIAVPLLTPPGVSLAIVGLLLFGSGIMTLAWYVYSQ